MLIGRIGTTDGGHVLVFFVSDLQTPHLHTLCASKRLNEQVRLPYSAVRGARLTPSQFCPIPQN